MTNQTYSFFLINKKGLEDSVFTWIIVFFMLIFIMFIYTLFMLTIFGKEKLTGININFKEDNFDLDSNLKLLNFLNYKIIVDGEEKRIINAIKSSLNPYFEIENNKGENFVEKYGLSGLNEDYSSLKNKMLSDGFDNNDWDNFLQAGIEFENSDAIESIINKLNKICNTEISGSENSKQKVSNVDEVYGYYLELPQGTITETGLKIQEFFTPSIIYYTDRIIHKTNYKGESIEIKLIIHKNCLD